MKSSDAQQPKAMLGYFPPPRLERERLELDKLNQPSSPVSSVSEYRQSLLESNQLVDVPQERKSPPRLGINDKDTIILKEDIEYGAEKQFAINKEESYPMPPEFDPNELIKLCDKVSSEYVCPNQLKRQQKDSKVVTPKKKRIRPTSLITTTQSDTTSNMMQTENEVTTKDCPHCYCILCRDVALGQYCVMSVFHFLKTNGKDPEVELEWFDCKQAYEDAYKEVMRVCIFFHTNYFEANNNHLLYVPTCMENGSMKEAENLFNNFNGDLSKYEKKYYNGALFMMENNFK